MEKDFDFKQVPYHWSLCYVSECERKEECLRYQAALRAPAGHTEHRCVLPTMMQKKKCTRFCPIQKVEAAFGFKYIFEKVLARDVVSMRSELASFLGRGGTYYRYRNGKIPLMPRQIDWIRNMFRRYGYSGDVVFDDSKELYVFD